MACICASLFTRRITLIYMSIIRSCLAYSSVPNFEEDLRAEFCMPPSGFQPVQTGIPYYFAGLRKGNTRAFVFIQPCQFVVHNLLDYFDSLHGQIGWSHDTAKYSDRVSSEIPVFVKLHYEWRPLAYTSPVFSLPILWG